MALRQRRILQPGRRKSCMRLLLPALPTKGCAIWQSASSQRDGRQSWMHHFCNSNTASCLDGWQRKCRFLFSFLFCVLFLFFCVFVFLCASLKARLFLLLGL